MNQQEARLVKNTLIFAIGTFGSKILSFLIVPLYSYFIDTETFGIYDLIVTTVTMLTPIITLQMSDGVYRWLIDESDNKNEIVTSTIKLLALCVCISSSIYIIVCMIVTIPLAFETWIFAVSTIAYGVIQQIIRGLGKNKLYSFAGILYTFISLAINLFGLIILKKGVEILFYSSSTASIICCMIFLYKLDIAKTIKVKMNHVISKEMIRYSLPLIPNAICWWFVNSVDRYMIRFYLGADANGIYSMSTKYPAIVAMIASIFYLAWQESAIKEYDTPNRNQFFSAVFNRYNKLLLSTVIVCIPFIKAFLMITMEQSYKTAWKYTGLLMIGCSFNALCAFLGIGYNISKDTKNALYTTLVAAVTDALLNLFLMKQYGLQTASFSTFASYFILFIIRMFDCRKYFKLDIKWIEFAVLFSLSIVILFLSFALSTRGCLVVTVVLALAWVIYNRDLFIRYGSGVISKIKIYRRKRRDK